MQTFEHRSNVNMSYKVSVLLMKPAAHQAHQVDFFFSGAVRKSDEYQEAVVVDGIMH